MIRRAGAMAALGVLAGGALTLGIAAPAQAVDVAPLSSYMLTVPPSVYSASAGYSPAEQVAYRESVRAGTSPIPPAVPVAPRVGWGNVVGAVITPLWLGGMFVMENAGTFGTVFGVSPGQMQDNYESAGATDYGEFWMCEELPSDWLGNLANGFNDWVNGLLGVDCDAIRDGWLTRNPAWTPLAVTDPNDYPYHVMSGASGSSFDVLKPVWSQALRNVGGTMASEGWVYPVKFRDGATRAIFEWGTISDTGVFVQAGATFTLLASSMAITPGNSGSYQSTAGLAACAASATVDGCIVPALITTPWAASATTTQIMHSVKSCHLISGTSSCTVTAKTLKHMSFIKRDGTGTAPAEAGLAQVLLTTVETADGNRYQCRTASFLETDVDIPRPCDPAIPAGQWEVSRTVEMIPATTGSWTVGSDPQRVMAESTSPAEYQQFKEDFPECSSRVCKLDLIKIGVGSCFLLGDTCDGWLADSARASKYTCTYDGQTTALSECEAAYPNVFNQTARDLGQAYPQPTDPATGEPSTGGQTSTQAGPVIRPGTAVLPPNAPRNCFPTGWNAFNPFEWIFQPVKCALEWAFVPRTEYVQQQSDLMKAKWTGSSLVGLLDVFTTGSTLVLSGGSGCSGPPVDLNIMGGEYHGYPLSACAEPMATVASFSRWFTFAAAWVMAAASIARSVAGVVGFTKLGGDDA